MDINFNANFTHIGVEKVGVKHNRQKTKNMIDVDTVVKAIEWTINAFPFAPRATKNHPNKERSLYQKYAENEIFLEMMDQCCNRLETHHTDIGYLLKNGISKEFIMYTLCQKEYIEDMKPLFSRVKVILGKDFDEAVATGQVVVQVKKWLKRKTTYKRILERRIKTPETKRNFVSGGQYFHLRKSTLQKIFIIAEDIFSTTGKETIWNIHEASLPGAFIAHKDKKNKCHLWHWSGRCDNLKDNPYVKINEGSYGVVQIISSMSKNETMVLKCAKKHLLPAAMQQANRSIINEIRLLNELAPLEGSEGIMDPPLLTSLTKSFTAYACRRYQGDLIDFYENLPDLPQFTVKDIYKAFLNVAKGLLVLQRKKIAHLDLKPNNLFFSFKKIKGGGHDLSFVLGDLGIATPYETIIKNKLILGYIPEYRLYSDQMHLKHYFKSNDTAKIESLLEGREAYAFGKIILEILTGHELPSNLPLSNLASYLKKFTFKKFFGKKMYKMVLKTHAPLVQDRLRIEDIVSSLEAALNPSSSREQKKLERHFTYDRQHAKAPM